MSSIEQDARRDGRRDEVSGDEWDRKREELRERGIAYCLSAYVDGHGIAKCKTVPIDHFGQMMRGSELFTGAAIDMLGQSPADDELRSGRTQTRSCSSRGEPTVAFAPGHLYFHGEPYPMCPRTVLTRQAERARPSTGFSLQPRHRDRVLLRPHATAAGPGPRTRRTRWQALLRRRRAARDRSTSSTRWSGT